MDEHERPSGVEYVDVLIVGAGISGIDAAYHLRRVHPGMTFTMLESKDDIGGTWYTHRFPGIRSDSDLYTFGFKWKPWTGVPIATASEILSYLNEALDENDLRRHIRFNHIVEKASWDSTAKIWHLTVLRNGEAVDLTCGFLWMCSGYYRHTEGYQPTWPGMDRFGGEIIHPQLWPEGLDYSGKRIVVIGSGATAATLVPAVAASASHVTMLQRSPTFYYPRPRVDEFAQTLRALELPEEWIHEIMRRKFLFEQNETIRRSFSEPQVLADELIGAAQAYLGEDYDVATHFTPSYRPWRQRVAMVPDGDLFTAIRSGKASVVTDTIKEFTQTGIELTSGEMLEADVIISATGLTLNVLGDVAFEVDGIPVDVSESWTHRGVMLTGLPNLAMVFGYLRTSWTMRADLVSEYVCRLLTHMNDLQTKSVVPILPGRDKDMPERPWIDPENFNSGYIQRALEILPKQGDRQPWLMTQDYFSDRETLPSADLDDGTLVYS